MNARIENYLNTGHAYLTDGGLETTLIFHDGVDLPFFASFTELGSRKGRARLDKYFAAYLDTAREQGTGFVLDTATWRANAAWGAVMDLDHSDITRINQDAVSFAVTLRSRWENEAFPIIVNGTVGPAGDGYAIDQSLTPDEAQAIHSVQIDALAASGADMATAVTMTHTGEAVGLLRAAQNAGIPVAVSFTVELDGNLPSGQSIGDAIAQVDEETGNYPMFFMINCAHPDHFEDALEKGEAWMQRIRGIRANASRMSHAELDEAEELDPGNPSELASDYERLQAALPRLIVLGGCCGTDHRHVSAIGHACVHKHAA